jgi:hypothetical protein
MCATSPWSPRSLCALASLTLPAAVLVLAGLLVEPDGRRPTELQDFPGADWSAVGLDARAAVLRTRLAARYRILQAVHSRRLTLVEAAALFRDLNRSDPNFPWHAFRSYYAGATDDERHCREIIDNAAEALDLPPAEIGALTARLEAELQEHLRYGPLRLPESLITMPLPDGP